ncbi:C-C motif chemokine 14-like [Eublepharis macularius]|uniref:C-C motif chemokine 14-like n=1 Tax=Eublepharis macularius TaxID=481883 RepID=A0AA97KKY9_EUBMA|nr:C-C motif chemokine 14-like [Eublepharis macularius]
MNSSMTTLMLFLVAVVLFQTQAQPEQPSACCVSYVKKPIPLRLLTHYEIRSKCSLPAVVFYSKANKMYCANPQAPWTQDRIQKLPENGQQTTP